MKDSEKILELVSLSSENKAMADQLKAELEMFFTKQDEKISQLNSKLSRLEKLMVEDYPAIIAQRFDNAERKIFQLSNSSNLAVEQFSQQLKNLHHRLDALEELDNERYIKALKLLAGKEQVKVNSSILQEFF